MKSKVIKHLQKAQDELDKVIEDALALNESVTNIDIEYTRDRIADIISELESIDEFETDSEDDTMFFDDMLDDDFNDNY